MKKPTILLIACVCFAIATTISSFWIIVSFLIFLTKDKPFQWISIICFIIAFALSIVCQVKLSFLSERHRLKSKPFEEFNVSAFQQRLHKMEELRKECTPSDLNKQ
jgi:hypothetical protein